MTILPSFLSPWLTLTSGEQGIEGRGKGLLALDPLPRTKLFQTEAASMVTKMAALVVMCLVLVNATLAPAHAQGKTVLFEDNFATLDPIWSNPGNNLSVKENKLLLTTEKDMCRFTLYKGTTFGDMDLYSLPKVFSYPPLTLTLSPRWGERGQEERTFGNEYKSMSPKVVPL